MSRLQNVRDVSIEAYHSAKITQGQRRVLAFLTQHQGKDFTRNELARESGIPINVICPRVNELIAAGVLEERVRRGCRFSGKQAHPVRLVPVQVAMEFA